MRTKKMKQNAATHNNNNVIDKPCAEHDKPKIVIMRLEAC
jgi:hypothetical protein